eukprot:Hpha_TRINITY_DN16990_c1_g3::TRINITY_DN16990_c1_g3_i1::g.51795::m.51795
MDGTADLGILWRYLVPLAQMVENVTGRGRRDPEPRARVGSPAPARRPSPRAASARRSPSDARRTREDLEEEIEALKREKSMLESDLRDTRTRLLTGADRMTFAVPDAELRSMVQRADDDMRRIESERKRALAALSEAKALALATSAEPALRKRSELLNAQAAELKKELSRATKQLSKRDGALQRIISLATEAEEGANTKERLGSIAQVAATASPRAMEVDAPPAASPLPQEARELRELVTAARDGRTPDEALEELNRMLDERADENANLQKVNAELRQQLMDKDRRLDGESLASPQPQEVSAFGGAQGDLASAQAAIVQLRKQLAAERAGVKTSNIPLFGESDASAEPVTEEGRVAVLEREKGRLEREVESLQQELEQERAECEGAMQAALVLRKQLSSERSGQRVGTVGVDAMMSPRFSMGSPEDLAVARVENIELRAANTALTEGFADLARRHAVERTARLELEAQSPVPRSPWFSPRAPSPTPSAPRAAVEPMRPLVEASGVADVEEYRARLAAATIELRHSNAALIELRKRVSADGSASAERKLEERVAVLTKSCYAQSEQLRKWEARCDQLGNELSAKNRECEVLKSELGQIRDQIDMANREREKTAAETQQLAQHGEAKARDLAAKLAERERRLTRADGEITALRKAAAASESRAQSEKVSLEGEVAEMSQRLREAEVRFLEAQ